MSDDSATAAAAAAAAPLPTEEELRREYARLLDPQEPLDSRMREVYRLKECHLKTPAGVAVLLAAADATDSVLLQHELVYNAGQSEQPTAVPGLEAILRAARYDTVTRHEAAEALGAIGSPAALAVLREYARPEVEPEAAVRESCELALARLAMQQRRGRAAVVPAAGSEFVSVDPSPDLTALADDALAESGLSRVPTTVPELEALLLGRPLPGDGGAAAAAAAAAPPTLFLRYMAMFSLRNLGTPAAVAALCRALREDTTSALFRHEVAFVLGQLERPASQPALIEALRDEAEAPMVRHEAAEALGAIADPRTLPVLREYATHAEPIVRDSCAVALEMHRYWSQFNSLGKTAAEGEEEGEEGGAAAAAAAA